jgi:2,3-dihydroxy-p-cumate/2,3-dihydroxybenzoate 3,4-dioxygenase
MINIIDLRYCRLGTSDVDDAVAFATQTIGLELKDRTGGAAYLRGDQRDHNICYFQGDPDDQTIGLEVRTHDELDAAASTLQGLGLEVRRGTPGEAAERRVMDFINFRDMTGNSIDIVVRPFHSGNRCFLSRDAGITEFSHIGLMSGDARRDEKFYSDIFNFRTNDWIGTSALMSFDEIHHRFAMFPSKKPGIQHINFQVAEVDDVMRSNYFLGDRQVKIVAGPGRHALSGARFLYFTGPEGMTYEYSCGVRRVDDEWRPRQFPVEDASFCAWGTRLNVEIES